MIAQTIYNAWFATQWLSLCLLDCSGVLGTAELPLSEGTMKSIEIEFDAFSGLPNPTWVLRAEHAEKVLGLFKNLKANDSREPLYDGLGYRGLKIRGLLGYDEVTIWNGIVQADTHGRRLRWHDKDRELERYLLATAKSYLKDPHALNALESVLREIGD